MPAEFDREVRFAVVIYGGVSLAVYINGVVQELLRMVRATAIEDADQLRGSEKVYRKLSCLLAPRAEFETVDLTLEERGERFAPAGEIVDRTVVPASSRPRTRFVVDVLSGTSAGGINAVYLAKALANDQRLDSLATMWITVADIEKLLNDRGSVEHPVRRQSPPKSLLNSRWMYLKLLEALDAMDVDPPQGALVDDLDLYSTTTDIDGVALPMALADKQVFELRHRNVFHFRRRTGITAEDRLYPGRNDFIQGNNPFMAFAARCTSAFPFAFEPMTLSDIYTVFPYLAPHEGKPYCNPACTDWNDFFLDYLRGFDPATTTAFINRSFGDGGYLDNKPFSYAIDTILTRHADLPVDRKLVYIEPSPEDVKKVVKLRSTAADRPSAVENSIAALVDLPRYETIRQDLERILEWNRNVLRVKRVMQSTIPQLDAAEFAAYREGPAYQFYLRLRLSSVTDHVATQVAQALKLDPTSAYGDAIRTLARRWRLEALDAAAEQSFLDAYDRDYLERGARFLRGRIRGQRQDQRLRQVVREIADARAILLWLAETAVPDLTRDPATPDQPEPTQQRDRRRRDLEFIVDPQFAATLRESLPGIPEAALQASDAGTDLRADYLLHTSWRPLIDEADRRLRAHFAPLATARRKLDAAMERVGGWHLFDLQDSVLFPVLFGTQLGEVDVIDVIRISPDDVAPIAAVDDAVDPREPKLKGQKLGAFGGFLDRRWRLHDMLRGRLHAAERLITAVLPDADPRTREFREALIVEAQSEIAREWDADFSRYLDELERREAAAGGKGAAERAR